MLIKSNDPEHIANALYSTDEDQLLFYKGDEYMGWVRLIYGNDGWDVINDYSVKLEWLMELGVNTLVDEMQA